MYIYQNHDVRLYYSSYDDAVKAHILQRTGLHREDLASVKWRRFIRNWPLPLGSCGNLGIVRMVKTLLVQKKLKTI